MIEFLKYIVKNLIDSEDKLNIDEKIDEENCRHYIISADTSEIGKIIGKEGKIIKAIRNLAKVYAVKKGLKVRIDIP